MYLDILDNTYTMILFISFHLELFGFLRIFSSQN
jgi:hypothetical protein